jgi:hypothetical protein
MTDETRILTEDESYLRRAEQAGGGGPTTITLCAEPACPRAARWGPHCDEHRPHVERVIAAPNLTDTELAELKTRVETEAAPLFVIAWNWIARQQADELAVRLGLHPLEVWGEAWMVVA